MTLPDGTTKTLPAGTTGLDLAASIGRRLAKDAVAIRVDGQPHGPDGAAARRGRGGHRHGGHGRRPPRAAPLHGPRPRPGRGAAVPRGQVLDRPRHRGRLLLRLRPARRAHVQRGRPGRHRGPDAGDREGRPAVRALRAERHRRPRPLRRPALQVRDHRAGGQRQGRRRRRRRGQRGRHDQRVPQHARVRRPVPRAARAVDGSPRLVPPAAGWPAPTGGATRSGRCSSASTARRGSPTPP